MSNGSGNIPASVLSRYKGTFPWSALVIGENVFSPSIPNADTPANWFLVVDLTSLKVVADEITTDNSTVPADVLQYQGNSQYFLYFIANAQPTYNLPQGPLATFLQAVGSGAQLAEAEQYVSQLGTGTITNFSYILAATMTADDVPGFESFSNLNYSVLAMQFMPVTIDGKDSYIPIQL